MAFQFKTIKRAFIKLFKLINYTRLFILNALFLFIIGFFILAMGNDESTIMVEDNSYLNLNLNGYLVEQKQPVNLSQQLSAQLSENETEMPQEYEVQRVVKIIKQAQQDPKITGLILQLDGLSGGSLDQLSDIGKAITQFKAANKKVIAYSENFSQTQYYLASYADTITLAPNGAVFLQGYAVNRLYFKDLIDNLLITPHIFKVGTYKSFVEPFIANEMSVYSKEANSHWLNQLWQHYITQVLTHRGDRENLTASSINPTLKELKQAFSAVSGDTARYALSVGLVDQLQYQRDFFKQLQQPSKDNASINMIDYASYVAAISPLQRQLEQPQRVAVITGTGEIVSGLSAGNAIADQSFNELLQHALTDDSIKAVVLRLDTPGGSAFASENIRQQVLALKKAGKKVVVSMGSVTASGGYWIAASADKIVATPTTLTGSIGIFGMFATVDKSLNKLGIHQDGVATNALSNIDVTQPLTPELAEIFQIGIESGYANFLKVVSEGRNMSLKAVDKIAQGRVWTGIDALQNGLVDELGNLQYAIKLAATLAELDTYSTVNIKPAVSPKQAFINGFFTKAITLLPQGIISHSPFASLLASAEKQVNLAARLNDPQSRFVYCTNCQLK